VQEFRAAHPIEDGWALKTRLISADDERVVFRAVVADPTGKDVAVGFAEEKRSNRGINATSALENCETSAIGRALAAAGFAGSEYASADELMGALTQQREGGDAPKPELVRRHHRSWERDSKRFILELSRRKLAYEAVATFCEQQSWGRPSEWSTEDRQRFLSDLDARVFTDLYDPEINQDLPDGGAP